MTIGIHGGTASGGGGTPADPSEVNIIEYGSTATTLGQKAKAASIPVTLASDQDALPVTDNGGSLTVDATNLDIRDLTPTSDTVAIGDGSATATVRNLAANDALNVAIVDGAGDQITSFGGGTQYTEGDVDASITGTAAMMEVAGNTLQPVQGTVADGLLVNLGTNNDVVETNSAAIAASLSVLDDWDESDRAKVNIIAGQVGVEGGAGAVTALTQRVAVASDNIVEVTATLDSGDTTLDSLNDAVTINAQGKDSVGFFFTAGTLASTTLAFEQSLDGSTWSSAYARSMGSGTASHIITTFTAASGHSKFSILTTGYAVQYRMRVSVYGSGSGTGRGIATSINESRGDPSVTSVITTPSAFVTQIGAHDTNNAWVVILQAVDSNPSATAHGLVVRNIPVRSGTATTSQVADNAASTTLLASNTSRLGASIHNDSSAVLYVKHGTTASATDYSVRMVQYSHYEVPFGYTGRIDGIWASDPGDGAARITEFT